MSTTLLLGSLVVVFVAGAVNGVAGFGFALLATATLATVVDPASAVVFVVLPILAVNLTLVAELDRTTVRRCARRFWPLVGGGLVGVVVGMLVIGAMPAASLQVGLGLLTLAVVASTQSLVAVPGLEWIREGCVVEGTGPMAGLGLVSGVVFGATNVGVQFVAYLRSLELTHKLFVGVVAAVFLGLNGIRVALAGLLGLYPDQWFLALSMVAVVPAVVGARLGARVRPTLTDRTREVLVLGLLAAVGLWLTIGGLTLV